MSGKKGRSGRRPIPTALKALRGTLKACRVNEDEPQPDRGIPDPPADFDRTQRRRWRERAAELDAIGVLTVADGAALGALVIADVRVSRANRHVNREGAVIVVAGVPRRNPWAIELHQAKQLVRLMCVEFGITPSSRTNTSASKAAPPAAAQTPREHAKSRFFGGA